jgi:hypothetical protein
MANSRIVVGKQGDQRFVLAHGDARQTANAAIGRASDAKACAAWWGQRSCPSGSSSQDSSVSSVSYVSPAHRGDEVLRVDGCLPSRDRCVREPLQRRPRRRRVFRDPIRHHLAVGVGGQDNAIPPACFHQPSVGKIHRRSTGGAGVCGGRRQSSFDNADVKRQNCLELFGEARTPIGAIVGESDNANEHRGIACPNRSHCRARARKQAGRRSSSSLAGMATIKPGRSGAGITDISA